MPNNYPKLHNAMWPGLVGKGEEEPPIDLDTMLDLTAAADVNGVKFDGVDLFLADPHTSIDADDDTIKALADKVASRGLVVGSAVAPVWEPVGGGSAMGSADDRQRFLDNVRKSCKILGRLTELGVRSYGVVRIDSATGVADWAADPAGNTKIIAETFRAACDIAADHGERLAAEGEICWGGMHSWKAMVDLLEATDRPDVIGFQADMAHTLFRRLVQQLGMNRIARQGLQGQGRDELAGAAGHDHAHISPQFLQLAHQFRRFVCGDAAAHAEQHIAID